MCNKDNVRNSKYKSNKWHPITNEEAYQLTGSTETKGMIYSYPIEDLPASIRDSMSGIHEAYVSNYITGSLDSKSMEILGKFSVDRIDIDIKKCYVYFFALSGSNVYFHGPYKLKNFHYFNLNDPLPMGSILSNSDFTSPPSC